MAFNKTKNYDYTQYDCGIHDLKYMAFQAGCPACDSERVISQLRTAYSDLQNVHSLLERELHEARQQADLIYAIRSASPLLSDNDREFLKVTLYEARNFKNLAMKVTQGTVKKKRQRYANGFLVMPRDRDPYAHLCDSVGGTAIATYYQEAVQALGPIEGMKILARGLSDLLPGA